jgi:hypothetical protein
MMMHLFTLPSLPNNSLQKTKWLHVTTLLLYGRHSVQLTLAYKDGIETSSKERDFMVFLKNQQNFKLVLQVLNSITKEEFKVCFQHSTITGLSVIDVQEDNFKGDMQV